MFSDRLAPRASVRVNRSYEPERPARCEMPRRWSNRALTTHQAPIARAVATEPGPLFTAGCNTGERPIVEFVAAEAVLVDVREGDVSTRIDPRATIKSRAVKNARRQAARIFEITTGAL